MKYDPYFDVDYEMTSRIGRCEVCGKEEDDRYLGTIVVDGETLACCEDCGYDISPPFTADLDKATLDALRYAAEEAGLDDVVAAVDRALANDSALLDALMTPPCGERAKRWAHTAARSKKWDRGVEAECFRCTFPGCESPMEKPSSQFGSLEGDFYCAYHEQELDLIGHEDWSVLLDFDLSNEDTALMLYGDFMAVYERLLRLTWKRDDPDRSWDEYDATLLLVVEARMRQFGVAGVQVTAWAAPQPGTTRHCDVCGVALDDIEPPCSVNRFVMRTLLVPEVRGMVQFLAVEDQGVVCTDCAAPLAVRGATITRCDDPMPA